LNILVTGADGFIGRALVARLASTEVLAGFNTNERQLVLLDQRSGESSPRPRIRTVTGNLTDAAALAEVFAAGIDCIFHLASVPGGASEANIELGLDVNLDGTVALLEAARKQGRKPRFIFASTIGVYGVPMPAVIDEDTLPEPSLSYGAQKWIGEILISDYSRRDWIDGRSLRLPGIVARPPAASGMMSAFLSDLIRKLSAGESFTCPVAASGKSWWMSRVQVVENLLHAAALSPELARSRGAWLLPVQHASISEVVDAIGRVRSKDVRGLVSYAPNAALQAQFANYPPLNCPKSVAAGFCHDGSLEQLVQRALAGP